VTAEEKARIFTIGHSTRTLDEFLGLLRANGVRTLVDVRTVPRSRRNPQFNRETLPEDLQAAGIEYVPRPGLGGLRRPRPDSTNLAWRNESFRGYADYMQTAEFEENLNQVVELASQGPLALMCAEAVPWRCHRSLIADALLAREIPVLEIIGPNSVRPHKLTPWARLDGRRVTYPAATATTTEPGVGTGSNGA
jgi:uncharacterized protein (DUF488 family)